MSSRAVPSRPIGASGVSVNARQAPSTWTWASVTGAEPSARRLSMIRPGSSRTASTLSSSTGGAVRGQLAQRLAVEQEGDDRREQQRRNERARSRRAPSHHLEMAHPAELGELRLVRVEHVEPGLVRRVAHLQDAALALALHHRVDRPERRRQRGAVVVVVEEVAMQVQRVDRVELGDVDEVDAQPAGALDAGGRST